MLNADLPTHFFMDVDHLPQKWLTPRSGGSVLGMWRPAAEQSEKPGEAAIVM